MWGGGGGGGGGGCGIVMCLHHVYVHVCASKLCILLFKHG